MLLLRARASHGLNDSILQMERWVAIASIKMFTSCRPVCQPYDGHTPKDVIEETEVLTGREIERAFVDKGYRGHDAPKPGRVFRSGQKRGVHGQIKKELRRRSRDHAPSGPKNMPNLSIAN